MKSFLAVGVGAAAGAWLRWAFSLVLNPLFPPVPLGTLASNLVGGFLMGVVLALVARHEDMSPALRLLMTTGFLGGLTTFSAFSGEAATLITRGEYGWSVALIGVHVVGSIAMTLAGLALTTAILGARA